MPPRQRQQKQRRKQPSEGKAVAAIAGALAIGASAQATAASLSPVLGIPTPSLLPVLLIAMSRPIRFAPNATPLPTTSATLESEKLEATFRAHYVLQAAKRLEAAREAGTPRRVAIERERQYFNQHIAAVANRFKSAQQVDQAAQEHGPVLGWYAKMDTKTSAECRAANGKNFTVTSMPPIGYPGAVHPHCRCRAGRRHATHQTVYSIQPEKKIA